VKLLEFKEERREYVKGKIMSLKVTVRTKILGTSKEA
jgi:hypothetical protein